MEKLQVSFGMFWPPKINQVIFYHKKKPLKNGRDLGGRNGPKTYLLRNCAEKPKIPRTSLPPPQPDRTTRFPANSDMKHLSSTAQRRRPRPGAKSGAGGVAGHGGRDFW